MDDNPGWRSLKSGELLHVNHDLTVKTTIAIDQPPAHQLTLADLGQGAPSQSQG
jgi:glutamine amidotransferase